MENKNIMQEKLIDSEKDIERLLFSEVRKLGGIAIKLTAQYFSGLPDRLVLLPKGRLFFAEIKTTGKKPRALQLLVCANIRKLGFNVYIIDNKQEVHNILEQYKA